jgi:hypothetical protein
MPHCWRNRPAPALPPVMFFFFKGMEAITIRLSMVLVGRRK